MESSTWADHTASRYPLRATYRSQPSSSPILPSPLTDPTPKSVPILRLRPPGFPQGPWLSAVIAHREIPRIYTTYIRSVAPVVARFDTVNRPSGTLISSVAHGGVAQLVERLTGSQEVRGFESLRLHKKVQVRGYIRVSSRGAAKPVVNALSTQTARGCQRLSTPGPPNATATSLAGGHP